MPILGLKFSRVPIIFEMKFKVLKTLHHLTSDFTVSASPTLSYFKFFQLLYHLHEIAESEFRDGHLCPHLTDEETEVQGEKANIPASAVT